MLPPYQTDSTTTTPVVATNNKDLPSSTLPSVVITPVATIAARAWLSPQLNKAVASHVPCAVTIKDALSMTLMHVWLVRPRDMDKTAPAFLFYPDNLEHKMLLVTKAVPGSVPGSMQPCRGLFWGMFWDPFRDSFWGR